MKSYKNHIKLKTQRLVLKFEKTNDFFDPSRRIFYSDLPDISNNLQIKLVEGETDL